MFKLFVLAFVLAVASAAPSYELYHQPASYSYQSQYVQHPSPVVKYVAAPAHPVVVAPYAPVAPIVKAYPVHAPIAPVVPVVKAVPAVYTHQSLYKAPEHPVLYPHY